MRELQQNWEDFRKTIGVCCLSSHYKSELMWSHYTNSYKGFCIGYDPHSLSECDLLAPVIYSEQLTALKSSLNFNNIYRLDETTLLRSALQCVTTKSPVWRYEDEWRIVETIEGEGKNIKVSTPNKLYIGCRISIEQKQKLINIARKLHIPDIREVELNHKKYELQFKRIY